MHIIKSVQRTFFPRYGKNICRDKHSPTALSDELKWLHTLAPSSSLGQFTNGKYLLPYEVPSLSSVSLVNWTLNLGLNSVWDADEVMRLLSIVASS